MLKHFYIYSVGKMFRLSGNEEMKSNQSSFPWSLFGVPHRSSQKNRTDIATFTLLSIVLGVENTCAYVSMLGVVQVMSMHMLKPTGKVVRCSL